MTILEQLPAVVTVPLREDPPGILRVGDSRVLLELIIHAHQQGETPDGIVDMYPSLELSDAFAVIAYYLTHRKDVDEYLHRCDREAAALRQEIETSQRPGPTKGELLARARAQGLNP